MHLWATSTNCYPHAILAGSRLPGYGEGSIQSLSVIWMRYFKMRKSMRSFLSTIPSTCTINPRNRGLLLMELTNPPWVNIIQVMSFPSSLNALVNLSRLYSSRLCLDYARDRNQSACNALLRGRQIDWNLLHSVLFILPDYHHLRARPQSLSS